MTTAFYRNMHTNFCLLGARGPLGTEFTPFWGGGGVGMVLWSPACRQGGGQLAWPKIESSGQTRVIRALSICTSLTQHDSYPSLPASLPPFVEGKNYGCPPEQGNGIVRMVVTKC